MFVCGWLDTTTTVVRFRMFRCLHTKIRTGQYCIDERGVHHLVPPAPVECEEGETAYGTISVHSDELELQWRGRLPVRSALPWPSTMKIRRT